MKVFLEYTEIITTIIANVVVIPSTIWAVCRFLRNGKKYIELDNEMNLITKQKEIKEIIHDLIIEPETLEHLKILIHYKKYRNKSILEAVVNRLKILIHYKRYRDESILEAVVNRQNSLGPLRKAERIKRGLRLLLTFSQTPTGNIHFSTHLDQMFFDFIEIYKNMNNRESDGIALRLDVFTKVDELRVRTILYLNAKEKEKLFQLKGFTDAMQILPTTVEFSELQKINPDFLRQTILGLILDCAVSDQLWIGDKISNEKELIKIFYPIYWEIGLS